ncbi:MAG: type II toxin-antitoxin system RelE/ParE family toxin [Deltaproteobacteria bacterium]|nr:type II toxin-antitoxin system RelE/ParE family toxin [Deltaproteobacteria bacterium]
MKVVWTPLAIERLQEIDAYISENAPTAAANFIELLFSRADSLAEFPYSGRIVPEFNREDYRELIEGNYRIIYRIKVNVIEIETVFEARRLLPKSEK